MAISLFSFINRFILFALCLGLSSVSYSAVVEGLFSTELEVLSQQSRDREAAFNEALVRVLLKVSGNRSLLEQNEFISRFFPAEQYVVSYAYKENPAYAEHLKQVAINSEAKLNESVLADAPSAPLIEPKMPILEPKEPLPFLLAVNFSASALEKDMINFGVPIWGNVRPSLQFWVVLEVEGQRQLLGQSNPHVLLNFLEQDAQRFALPIIFPIGDEIDREAVNISNLWGLFPDAIEQAKGRYVADGDVMLRVYRSLQNTWNANWHMSVSGASYSASISDVDLETVSETVISYMARVMADRFAIQPGLAQSANQLLIDVSNVKTFKDYIEIQSFLEKLAPVKTVTINWIEGTTLSLALELNSAASQFFEYLSLSGKFMRLDQPAEATNAAASTRFEGQSTPLENRLNQVQDGTNDINMQAQENAVSEFEFMPRAEQFKWLPSAPAVNPK